MSKPTPGKIENAAPAWVAPALFAAVFCLFLPCVRNGFINFDDAVYLTDNAHIQHGITWDSVRWAFTTGYASNWHPLTWLSHMIDWQLFGARPWGHHLVNVALHAASATLLFLALRRMTGATWRSLFVAALFGIHPLRVESVAWAAERKDVLSTFFLMLTLLAYAGWAKIPAGDERKRRIDYALVLLFFALGLMSKPMLVTLPFVLLLLDYWPLGRLRGVADARRLVVEKIPFFVLAFAASVVTYRTQQQGGAITIEALHLSWGTRIANALLSYGRYLGKLFFPSGLALFYPLPPGGKWPAAPVIIAAAIVLAITAFVVMRARRQPYLFTGWCWYLGTALPVIGLVQVGTQAMADRYTYVPLIGVIIAFTWAVCDLTRAWQPRRIVLPAAAALSLAACACITLRQLSYWKDSVSIFERTIAVTPQNPLAELNLACALAEENRVSDAIPHFERSIAFSKIAPEAHLNFGLALLRTNMTQTAAVQFQAAIAEKPGDRRAHFSYALALQELGYIPQAAEQYETTTRLNPDYPDAHFRLGAMRAKLGDTEGAIAEYHEALRLNPGYIEARNNLGIVLFQAHRWDEAIREFTEVIRENPGIAETHNNLGIIYENQGKLKDALAEYREAVRLNPDYAPARTNLDAVTKILAAQPQ